MRPDLWIIESREPDGTLKLDGPQPYEFFGPAAIHGITDTMMARMIWQKVPDAVMDGRDVYRWPSLINPAWVARRKTWR